MSTLDRNCERLQEHVRALLAAGRAPLTFVDLDDTINSRFGGLVEAEAVAALGELAGAGGLFGLNTGADIVWTGERVLSETERLFSFPFLLLATGTQIYALVESLRAYARLPLWASDKGLSLRSLAEYVGVGLDDCIYIADFPGAGDLQEGIDDPVLREPLGAIVNVGAHRPPEAIRCVSPRTLLLHPEWRGEAGWEGTGYAATATYLRAIAEALRDERYAETARARRAAVMGAVERKLGVVPATETRETVWTFERPALNGRRTGPLRIVAGAEGLVHAGVRRGGHWVRIYDVPLRETTAGVWEATLLDPEVNEFTFIWYDAERTGRVRWEGQNFTVQGD